mgnify:CR=1 FL=1
MKKVGLLISALLTLLVVGKNTAQNLVCNDLVQVALDGNCSHTLVPEEVLEGVLFSDCVVELDKTVPFGNGPWVAPVLGSADIGKTYQVRVRHVPSGNSCWGNVKSEDKLPPVLICNGLSTVDLGAGGAVSVSTANLSITAADGCSAMTLLPATLQYDCSDEGVNIVQLTATDASGNSSTCLHTVLVANSTDCQTCLSNCPQSVAVNYDEGNNNLLPAFQSNDWSVFDAFGNASFDPACMPLDSIYTMNFEAGTAGQSWFSRQWMWLNNVGQIITCEQVIAFPATHIVTVQGKVYLDTNDDCSPGAGEQGVDHFSLVITKLPSGASQTFYPQPDGTYSIDIEFGVQDVSAQLHLALPANVNPVCPSALDIPNAASMPVYNFDIGLQSQGNCPVMQVGIGNLFTRKCAANYFNVTYCNVGLDTAYGAFVTVNLDPLISLQFADLPYTVSGPDDVYTFQLGNVPPFYCGTIALQAMVSCAAVSGQTLCNEAGIFPDVPCNGAWQGAKVAATAQCSGDSVSLELKNTGLQNMTVPRNYIVVEDFIMYKGGSFQLAAGEAITIKTPANGATWRLEAEQTPGFPVPGLVAAAIEGCGGLNSGLINMYAPGDNAITYDQDCSEVVASCDPNDKTAVPTGYDDQHLIRANETIEYKIRFQNTGTDTAFQVVIVDTLSPLLDARTLETGASSHPYHLEIYPGGILHFVFRPIALPDSNVNEIASHGYVKFRIGQQPDLADGTVIENTAAIYFDQNNPVFTNTAFHTIGYPFVQIPPLSYSAQTFSPTCNGTADGAIQVAVTGGIAPYSFHWSDPKLHGDSLTGLPAGAYQVTLTDSHGGELVQNFDITAPAPVVISLSSTPAIGNDNNGTASAIASGGTSPYSYLWNNGATTESLSGLAAGTYAIVVTDANGCTESSTVTVPQNVLPLTYVSQTVDPLCNGTAEGAIFLAVSGGLMPYSFLWSNPGLQGDSLTGLPAGTYEVTLTDSNGSEFAESFMLTEPSPVVIAMGATPAWSNENNGTASAAASGGTGPYTYLWNNGATTENLSGLAAGTYTVVVTDANGCTQSNAVVVQQVVATDDPGTLSRIQVWPNPAHDRILLDIHQVLPQLLRMDMLSADGRMLQQFHAEDLQPLLTLNLENDQAGGFILLVLHGRDGSVFTEKVVIR